MVRKRLIFIGGPMGVGKTTLGQYLVEQKLNNAVFLDGDWCWYMSPWNFNDENKQMVIKNIRYLLSSFVSNSQLENIVFVWVMHQQTIVDDILAGVSGDYDFFSFSLVPSEAELKHRFTKDIRADIRDPAALKGAIERIPMYRHVHSIKIDVANHEYPEIAEEIIQIISTNNEKR
ncbi:MAG: AAA family ATPase [Oenococcus sp.]|uniref:AAA family ATPase n=1 Tax=Oenococcus sp. TaxID=1979414 RepID=UPI0039EBD0FD